MGKKCKKLRDLCCKDKKDDNEKKEKKEKKEKQEKKVILKFKLINMIHLI